MALNAVQLDILCLENRLMVHGRQTWVRHSRHKECELLGKFFRRKIGKSWLDDNRGALKRNGFHRAWQTGRQRRNGTYDGSESRRQFTLKACYALTSRGIKVLSRIWHAAKPGAIPPTPKTPQLEGGPAAETAASTKPGRNPFEDYEFRDKHHLKPIPPIKPD